MVRKPNLVYVCFRSRNNFFFFFRLQLGDTNDTVVCNSMQKMRQNVLRPAERSERCDSRFPLHSLQTQRSVRACTVAEYLIKQKLTR